MGQTEILNIFFENPTKDFHIRRIAKELNIPKTTVSYQINIFLKKNIIIKNKEGIFPSFRANETHEMYRFYKKQYILKKIIQIGLLDYLEEEIHPKSIILFGSFAKAEYDKDSDIDFFVQAKELKINLNKFEKKLKHKINIIFENSPKNLSKELLNNIVNGIKLRGFLRI